MITQSILALASVVAFPSQSQPRDLPAAQTTSAARQSQAPAQRMLEVPARASWQHAESQIILPPRLADLQRESIGDLGRDELDIVASYRGADGTIATVYLFKSTVPNPSIWFDRALFTLRHPPGRRGPAGPATIAGFTPPGRITAGSVAVFGLSSGGATALALVPAARRFLLKVRVTSPARNPAQLSADLTRLLGDLRWPQWQGEPAPAIVPIPPCAQSLRTRQAREMRPDPGNALMSALMGGAPTLEPSDGAYCLEPGATQMRGVYRAGNSTTSYLVAIGDSGLAISARPAMSLEALQGQRPRGSETMVAFHDRESTAALPNFDRLPPPDQVLQALLAGRISVTMEQRGQRDSSSR